MDNQAVEMRAITKSFGPNIVLSDVTFSCRKGEVVALVGENGAGKSTLLKILVGALSPNEGEILIDGKTADIENPAQAQGLGIGIIYQEFNLIPYMTVAENIFLGKEIRGRFGFVDYRRMKNETAQLFSDKFELSMNPEIPVHKLSIAEQQIVEIAKALLTEVRVLVMDEPTASLSIKEVENLFKIIRDLRNRGISIIIVTHRIKEIFQVADSVTVLKDGKVTGVRRVAETDESEIIKLMVGREILFDFPARRVNKHRKELVSCIVENEKGLKPIEFCVYEGEALTLFGLQGQGQREILRSLFLGGRKARLNMGSKEIFIRGPKDAMDNRVGFIPDDRKDEGLCLTLPVFKNLILPNVQKEGRSVITAKVREKGRSMVSDLDIRVFSLGQEVENLSGGNQQKVVIGKWLSIEPRLLLMDDPTRGIDVETKIQIYNRIHELTEKGLSIVMTLSDIMEVMGLSDRILVIYKGEIVNEFKKGEISEENLMSAAVGQLVQ